jgi:hypothetical protein
MNLACVLIKPLLMLTMIMVIPIVSMTKYEKATYLERDVDEIDKLP